MKTISYLDNIIKYSFYSLFFFVPLIFMANTSELFEFNKMWLAFGLTIIISAAWFCKMIIKKRFILKKTPLDIPLILFLASQAISTIFSFDNHVSFWGYYSRFNGGLLSAISYILLYYAFVSNLQAKHVFRVLFVSLISGTATALWGFPSHFGYDPTCFIFRGSFDTNCWTEAFKPTVRVFSTLGQPAWFAAYLNVLLPLSVAYFLINAKKKINLLASCLLFLSSLFYISLIFTNTRAGFAAFFISDIVLWIIVFYKKIYERKRLLKYLLILHFAFVVCNFFYGTTIGALDKFTFPQLQKKLFAYAQAPTPATKNLPQIKNNGITDSGQIRLYVWRGAIDAWRAYPIFGTGVETFAFAYYRYRPAEHNLTSEWDYLYNKAHNEYLNYLTTTGIFGLGTYLLFIGFSIFLIGKMLLKNPTTPSAQKNNLTTKQFPHPVANNDHQKNTLLLIGLFSAWLSILITNFFGFSVVIMNLYLFLIPAFLLTMNNSYPADNPKIQSSINAAQWTLIIIIISSGLIIIYNLYLYWYADTAYALGNNYNKVNAYQKAYPLLENAVRIKPNEPVYKDELAINLATLAQLFYMQNDATTAAEFGKKAIYLSDQVTQNHPNNVVYWKNRLRIIYSLSTGDKQNTEKYLQEASRILTKAYQLAPTDPKISFNLGVVLGQMGNLSDGIKMLEKTIKLKPNYIDAYYALGAYYRQLAIGSTTATASPSGQEIIVNPQMRQKAIDTYQYILDNLSPNDEQIKSALQTWKEKK